MSRLAALVLLLAASAPAWADGPSDMAAAANRFYATYASLPRQGGLPEGAARGRYLPLLSARLTGLFNQATAAERRFHAREKDSPPLIEGDIFSSQFEGFQSYKVGACSGTASAGRCSVALHYQEPGQKAVDWTDELLLVKEGGSWKVDDIAYRAPFASSNSGFLSQTLKIVISTAP